MAFLKQVKWWIFAAAAVVIPVVLYLLRGLFSNHELQRTPGTPALPPPPKALQQKLEKAEEEALVARAEIKVKTEVQKAQLAEIGKTENGAERRKKLAEMLRTL